MIHRFTQWFICTGQESSVSCRENKLVTDHFPGAGNGAGFAAWFVYSQPVNKPLMPFRHCMCIRE